MVGVVEVHERPDHRHLLSLQGHLRISGLSSDADGAGVRTTRRSLLEFDAAPRPSPAACPGGGMVDALA